MLCLRRPGGMIPPGPPPFVRPLPPAGVRGRTGWWEREQPRDSFPLGGRPPPFVRPLPPAGVRGRTGWREREQPRDSFPLGGRTPSFVRPPAAAGRDGGAGATPRQLPFGGEDPLIRPPASAVSPPLRGYAAGRDGGSGRNPAPCRFFVCPFMPPRIAPVPSYRPPAGGSLSRRRGGG